MALTLPMLLVVLLAIVDFGFLFQRYEVITNAAREGVRYSSRMNVTGPQVETHVINYVADAGLPNAPLVNVAATTLSANGVNWPATEVTVTYDHQFTFLGPFAAFVGGSFGTTSLAAQSVMRTELPLPGTP